ncbi:hypothetical protein NBM05_07430 [Rothia sp. AR01]|uniref:Uncharacterized protein n=1 Tax=Rothia santali TaxID=2949643 RepID=A0A9X2KHH5_9MICC|nr:hypothetical protein [Rothia santali]MCP3425842.1 hypothetical protein [Rothia santali]
MAVPTKFDIKFNCGHSETRDLSDKPAGERKGFANWLGNSECRKCWRDSNKDEYQAKQLENAKQNQKALGLPDLDGTEAQLKWAPILRNNLIVHAHSDLTEGEDAELSEDEFEQRILEPARLITRAHWWMDNADSESEDLEELVTTAGEEPGIVNENPY